MLHFGGFARRTRECAVATSTGSAASWWLRFLKSQIFFLLLIFGTMAPQCRGRVVRHSDFVALQSTHSEGERGKAEGFKLFCLPPRSWQNSRRIRRGFRSYVRGSPNSTCTGLFQAGALGFSCATRGMVTHLGLGCERLVDRGGASRSHDFFYSHSVC